MNNTDSLADPTLFQNPMLSWLIALGVLAGLFFLLLAARAAVRRYYAKLKATRNHRDRRNPP